MKKIIQIIASIFLLSLFINPLFANQKVEDIFIDIDKNFEYKNQLQYLYDLGFIGENNSKTFQPNSYISREEFVGLLLETNCQTCVKPKTNIDILSTYYDKNVYYDVTKNSNYFYCVAYADDKKYIQGYQPNTVCDNGETSDQAPFCPYNSIKFEEALAIIMRTSGILTQTQADEIIQEIYNGTQYPDIGNDIKPKFENGEIYSFYPYFYAAQNYSITDIDSFGNISELFLLKPDQKNYYPQAPLSKSQMLALGVFSHKNSECSEPKYDISGYINILNGACNQNNENCNISPVYLVNKNFDFRPVFGQEQVIEAPQENYKWVITHLKTGEQNLYTGKYLDNIFLEKSGEYTAEIYVTDVLGNKAKFSQNFTLSDTNNDFFNGYISQNQNGNSFDFIANISGNTGEYTYFWDFGDGNTSTDKNPKHSYSQSGNYNVVLKVTDSNEKSYEIYSQAEINNNKTDGYIGVDLIFIGENNVADFNSDEISAENYFWDFGDGNSSTDKNPNHSYSQPGEYEVTLITQDQDGEKKYNLMVVIPESSDDISATIQVQNSNQQNSYNFTPKVQSDEGPFEYFWDFGDGNTSTQQNPTHQFKTTGNHTVTLQVTYSNGNSTQASTQIWIDSPNDNLQALVQNTQNPFIFDFSSIKTGGGENTTFTWDFGDGNVSTDKNPSHQYETPGEYEVTLKVQDGNSTTEITMIVVVADTQNNLDATAEISSQNLDTNTYDFQSEIISGEGPFEYLWDFGDGNTSTDKNPTHRFTGDGPFQISVLITDKNGNKVVKNFVIYPDFTELETQLEIQNEDQKNTYKFDSNIISGKGPFEYLWNFGDGNISNQKNPTHEFQYNGEYFVELTTTDMYGNSQTKYVNIIVGDAQNGDFNIQAQADKTSGFFPLNISFSSTIIGNQNDEYSYLWDFGDSTSATGKNTQHIYYTPGSYIVTLQVQNITGEIKEKNIIISVLENQESLDDTGEENLLDTDGDSIADINDKCINIAGSKLNQGCPIFETFCQSDSDCPNSSQCASNLNGTKTCVAVTQQVACSDSTQGVIQGNVVCDTCPCQNTINFKSQLRSCDIIFPAIVSPDGKNIYSKGQYFQIK